MVGFSLCALAFLAFQQDAPTQEPAVDATNQAVFGGDRDLSFKDLVSRTYDARWMLSPVQDGESVETSSWAVDDNGVASVSFDGQGVVARLWLSEATGQISFFVDGSESPSLEWDLDTLLAGPLPKHLDGPLFMPVGEGFVSRIPLPFQKSIRIDFSGASGLTGDIDVRRFSADVKVPSLSRDMLKDNRRSLSFAAQVIRDNTNPETIGEAPLSWKGSFNDSERNPEADYYYGDFRVAIVGNGVLRWFELEFPQKRSQEEMREVLRSLTLRMELNTEKTALKGDVVFEVPLGDFLGSSPGLNPFQTHLVGYNEATGVFYCRMPVPFVGGLKVSVSSDMPEVMVLKSTWGVNKYAKAEDVPPMRLRSGWVRSSGTGSPLDAVLELDGQARLLGYTFSSTATVADPQAFNGPFNFVNSWHGAAPLAFEHLTLREGPGGFGHTSAVRFFGLDAPTGANGLIFDPGITLAEKEPTDYSALAWWYAPADAACSFPTDASDARRLPILEPTPSFFAVEDAFECESLGGALMAPGSTASIVEAADDSS